MLIKHNERSKPWEVILDFFNIIHVSDEKALVFKEVSTETKLMVSMLLCVYFGCKAMR